MEVSVIVPIYNEEKTINKCINSLISQTVDKNIYEILVIDGGSEDNTRSIVKKLIKDYNNYNIKLLNNSQKITPVALNIGIQKAKGDIVIRVDGHVFVENDFIKKSLDTIYSSDDKTKCVGGTIETINENIVGEAISMAMSCPFGVGNALFRYKKEESFVDTLAFGAYYKDIFNEIGYFDEELVRNQDDELNYRLIKNGYKILLNPKIKSYYYSRTSYSNLWNQYFQYGFWKIRVIKKHKSLSSIRQIIPFVFVCSLFISFLFSLISKLSLIIFLFIMASYFSANLFFSIKKAYETKYIYFNKLLIIFPILHLSYGIGFIIGIFHFFIFCNSKSNKHSEITR